MFDRQRSSKPQMPRKVASKVREELEVDAAEKEARLAELRSTMSKEKQEIDKLISQRGPTLWTSSSEIRASPGTRQALPTKSLAAKAKGGVLTEALPLKQATQPTSKKVDSGSNLHGAQPKVPGKPGPFMAAEANAAKESSSYRASPTRRLSNAASGKSTGPRSSNQLGIKHSPQKASNPKAALTDGSGGSNATISSAARQGSAQAFVAALPVDKSMRPVKAFNGPSLLDGDFNEDDSHASFADALSSWRGKAPAQAPTPTGPNAAPGTSTQAKILPAAASPAKQTYFERLLWNQASQEAAAAVAGKPARSFADDKEAALQIVLEKQNNVFDS
ncbi:hypothetical protein WJX79_010991 [Trebouxia sp. C0005]